MAKLKAFLELDQAEVCSLDAAMDFVEILSNHNKGFSMSYTNCQLGEFWYFKKG